MKKTAPQTNAKEQCVNNLRNIHTLLKLYVHQFGSTLGFPANLDAIYPMSKDPAMFICPADMQRTSPSESSFHTSYRIVNNPLKAVLSKTPPSKIAIVAEKTPNHEQKRFVLFYDGSIRELDKAQFEKLKKSSFVETDKSNH